MERPDGYLKKKKKESFFFPFFFKVQYFSYKKGGGGGGICGPRVAIFSATRWIGNKLFLRVASRASPIWAENKWDCFILVHTLLLVDL